MSSNDEDASHTARPFRCPSCGSTLEIVDAPAVTCRYCGSHVPVPSRYRTQKAQPQIVIQTGGMAYSQPYAEAMRGGRRGGLIITLIILLFIGGITAFVLTTVQSAVNTATDAFGPALGALEPGATRTAAPSPTPAFAEVTLEFGGEGSGPGLFDDPRFIAVDKDGGIYVADFDDGRVQKFDAGGAFVWQITTPPDAADYNTIEGLAVDFQGNVYVSRRGDILVLSAEDGALVNTFPGQFAETWYTLLAADANNTLYALHESAGRDDLLVLNAEGQALARWQKFVSSQNRDDPAISLDVAVDGAGQVYVSSSFGDQVYVFDKAGKFVDRFGQEGDEPGAMNSPGAIAVDGRNRIYVVNFGGVDVYDARGNYVNSLPRVNDKGAIRDLAVDIQGNIYAVTTDGIVLKFKPSPRG